MREESGRSLIEIIGVLAIGVTMLVAAYGMYKTIDQRQKRLIAYEAVQDVAKKTRILYAFSGYSSVSVANLQSDQAIESTQTPIGTSWSIGPNDDNNAQFKIRLEGLDYADCEYFRIKKADWAIEKQINYNENGQCGDGNNVVDFIVE